VPGVSAEHYVEQSLDRLRNTAICHRNHQIATDGSQKIVQRLLAPIAERLRRGESVTRLAVAVAAWIVYLIRSSDRFGKSWTVADPYANRIADIAERVGSDTTALAAEILAIDTIFGSELAASAVFREAIVDGLDGLLSDEPMAYVRRICDRPEPTRLKRPRQTG
jgi:fructuronate reductase